MTKGNYFYININGRRVIKLLRFLKKTFQIFLYFFVYSTFLFCGIMIGYYGARFVYFYRLEQKKEAPIQYNLYEYLVKDETITEHNFKEEDGKYYYPTNAINNYIYFSGLYYRILYFDENSICVIVDEPVTNLKYGETGSYEASQVKDWLEKVYLPNLNEQYLKTKEVTLLDKETYIKIGAEKSFIPSEELWILDDDSALILTEDGSLAKPDYYTEFLGVKPVIELNSTVAYVSGDGTKENPYLLENHLVTNIEDSYVGEYILYGNQLLRVIEKNEWGVKVLSVDPLEEKKIFSPSSNIYNAKTKNSLGYYLNNDYIKKFHKEDLVESKWYIGEYIFDYKDSLKESTTSYMGLLRLGDYFITNVPDSYLLNRTGIYEYAISNEKFLIASTTNQSLSIYPVFVLKPDLLIESGTGLYDNPYIVGE